jgi:hypothetical protein
LGAETAVNIGSLGGAAASAILGAHEGATLSGLGIGLNSLLAPARRLYKSRPGLSRWVNRALWALAGPRDRRETRSMIQLFERVQPYTLIGGWGLLALYRLCREADRLAIPGAFVECGVYRGGCGGVLAALAAQSSSPRRTWLFDSFEGLPEPSREDQSNMLASAGRFAAPIDDVRRLLFTELQLDPAAVSIEKGWFDRTLPAAAPRIGPIAVLRLDADLYDSTRCCLETLYDNVGPGGFVLIDDYYGWPGCRKAVDEFLERRGVQVEMSLVDPLDRARRLSAVYFQKPARERP